MERNDNDTNRFGCHRTPRLWIGIMLLIAGVLLLAYKMGAPIPGWFFTWPVLLIGIGILTGLKSRFHNPGAFILIIIGSIFLVDQTSPELHFHNYILPVILIGVGPIYITRPKNTCANRERRKWRNFELESHASPAATGTIIKSPGSTETNDAEHVEINAVLSGVKKIVLSKNFKGGEINAFMGGTEINLLQADIQSPIVLEVNNVFGGTKLIVPSNWDVKNEVTAVFGGIDDKRNVNTGSPDAGKILILKGTCVFGGIEVTNY